LKGKFYQFATYNKSKINRLRFSGKTLEMEVENKSNLLKVTAIQQKGGNLKAPVTGQMNRVIKESIDSEIEIRLFGKNDETLFSTNGKHAGMELIEKILTYF